jgi:hypothetical protein
MSNTTKTSIELAEDLVRDYCKGIAFVPAGFFDNIKKLYLTEIENAYQDGKEFAIIKDCATDSTSAAHKFSIFRNHIIAAFDQGVIAEFTHQVSGAPETSGQEYFNQTYGDGVQ